MDSVTLSEYLDVIWFCMIERGTHGMTDSFKYRKAMTEWVFTGEIEQTAEEKLASAKAAIGKEAPKSAIEQARELRERLLSNKERKSANVDSSV
jgi:hypothetical protein